MIRPTLAQWIWFCLIAASALQSGCNPPNSSVMQTVSKAPPTSANDPRSEATVDETSAPVGKEMFGKFSLTELRSVEVATK